MLEFDEAAYNCYQSLRWQRIQIGTQDLRIAAVALATGAILVTRNQRDFSKVPNLCLEDWTMDEYS
ncbi:MAG: type II toxin-antitoxin system VapC family toxin [Nostoc sp. S4]|nr:type II toxin-antitoxin system VapC family toxin [Nostoc sp. S4]